MAIEQELPQDLLMEILSRLPVKSLLRLKSVSKYWFSLIQNPSFIHLHFNCSKKKDYLVVMRLRNGCNGDPILSSVPDKTATHDLFESFEGLNLKDVNLIASSNGLFFLAHFYKPKFVICNPATKEFRILPDPFHHARNTSHLGFVFDPNTKDYKVVRVATLYESDLTPYDAYDSTYVASDKDLLQDIAIDKKVYIYDLSTDCWREVDADVPKYFPSEFCYYFHTSLNGVFYWLYPSGYPMINGFGMLDELFEEIPVPDISWLDCFPSTLCTLNDSLALIVETCRITPMEPVEKCFDFWVMEEHGIKESWTKKYTIGPFFGEYISPLGFRQNGELLMNFEDKMVSYNVDSEKMKEYKIYCNPTSQLEFLLYTECLISVKRRVTQDIMGVESVSPSLTAIR